MKIRENLKNLLTHVPSDIKTVIVSKNHSVNDIMEVYNMGYRMFGENKAQELLMKQPLLPPDIEWHFIGHLQTNKVRPIAAFIDTIQSVDSYKLLQMIGNEAFRHNRTINCLLQFHIATEETKFGLDIEEAKKLVESFRENNLSTIKITGVMGMASYSDDENLVREEFNTLITYFHILKSDFFADDEDFREISMGMSGDYQLAIQQGSTMIRLGTAIFGERDQD